MNKNHRAPTKAKKKKLLLEALEKSLGVVTTACKSLGIGRETFYKFYNEDNEFAAKVDDIQNIAVDFVESKLYQHIQNNDVTSAIFYLKTKGRNRGYSERFEIDGSMNGKIEIEIHTANEDKSDGDIPKDA